MRAEIKQPENSMTSGPRRAQPVSEEPLQIVSFRVGSEEFGLDILCVREIIRHQHLTRVPNSPAFVDGVINLRGQVIPVVALHKLFAVERPPHPLLARIVVLEVQQMLLGFIVDSVPEVLRMASGSVVAPPQFGKVQRDYVCGMARFEERLLILLDADRILASLKGAASPVSS